MSKKSILQSIIEDDETLLFENEINDVMQHLRSSDFDPKKGINEAGLKMILLSILINDPYYKNNKDIFIESELPVPNKDYSKVNVKNEFFFKNSERYNNFLDITIITAEKVIIIELKYIKMKFIKNNDAPNSISDKPWRTLLQEWVIWMNKLDKEKILDLRVSTIINNKTRVIKIKNLIKEVSKDQSERYNRLYRFRYDNIPEKLRPLKQNIIDSIKIKSYVGIGVGNRFVIE